MFADAALHQRQHGPGRGGQSLGPRVPPVLQQPRPGLGQVFQAVAHVRLLVEGVAHQARELARERIGNHAGALDQPGVAVAGAIARLLAVDQYDLAATGL
ncbi:hypothetical protein D3C78_1605700 [compost metagenome]